MSEVIYKGEEGFIFVRKGQEFTILNTTSTCGEKQWI